MPTLVVIDTTSANFHKGQLVHQPACSRSRWCCRPVEGVRLPSVSARSRNTSRACRPAIMPYPVNEECIVVTWIMFLKFLDDMEWIREEEAILCYGLLHGRSRSRTRLVVKTTVLSTGYWIRYDWLFLKDGSTVAGSYRDPGSCGPSVGSIR